MGIARQDFAHSRPTDAPSEVSEIITAGRPLASTSPTILFPANGALSFGTGRSQPRTIYVAKTPLAAVDNVDAGRVVMD